ncbi:hypothetical protein NFI95_04080 [Acetobacteraceae bacterium KSS8]|uniref:Muconolactone isomerase domain-containing protein n=1 Tax=Endosaccharibacter trunci TaxID=2812733 RepID=A0ABT1W442_9PROT|nr:hypothetical protein [Acetobacteraceae bacterium KSS8]
MTRLLSATLAAGLAATVAAGSAQADTPSFPKPVTHILAIGTLTPGTTIAEVRAILPTEVRETVKLYLAGKIDRWFSLADRNGVVFLLNVTDPKEAHAMLEALPLGQAHLMRFELLPLAPLAPLRQLPGVGAGSP